MATACLVARFCAAALLRQLQIYFQFYVAEHQGDYRANQIRLGRVQMPWQGLRGRANQQTPLHKGTAAAG